MIVIEGPDGAGKTTLIQDIKAVFGLEPEPRAVSHDAEPLVDLVEWVEQELRRGQGWRLYDRFALISAPNYCMLPDPTFQGLMLDQFWLKMMWHRFRAMDPLVICCLPPKHVVWQNVMGSEDNLVVREHIHEIWCHYHSMAAMMNWLVWDYTQPSNRGIMMNNIQHFQYVVQERENRMNAHG